MRVIELARVACTGLVLSAVVACRPTPRPVEEKPAAVVEASPEAPALPAPLLVPAVWGGAIPADDPRWEASDGYRHSPAEYGQPDWDHVRIYAVVHVALAGRDRARARAVAGDYDACASRYAEAERVVRGARLANPAVTPVREVLADGLARDGAVCDALARGQPPVIPADGGVAMYRARYLGLHARAERGTDIRRAASALADELGRASARGGTLQLEAPGGERDPARLAAWLAAAWVDTVDPIAITEPWGAWSADERPRQVKALRAAVAAAASGETRRLPLLPATSLVAQPPSWTVEEFDQTPLLDAYVDVGGFAAPHVVPQLPASAEEKAQWTAWLAQRVTVMSRMRAGEVPRTVRIATGELLESGGARAYFRSVGLQNAAVRQLARKRAYGEALAVVRAQSPLRGLDWYAPDRAAVLLGLEGRLMVLAGDARGEKRLQAAIDESRAFLAFIDVRAAAEATATRARAPR